MVLIRSHDALVRYIFGEPEQMAELLRACLPPAMAAAIDWSTLRRVEGSFVDEALQNRRTDMLFEVRMGEATVLLYTVFEHKSHDDHFTSWQMARYVVRVVDQWLVDHPEAKALPAVLPFVLYHGDRAWQAKRSPHELVDLRGCEVGVATFLRPLQMRLPFHLLDLSQLDEGLIDAMRLSAISALTLRFLQFLRQLSTDDAVDAILRWQPLAVRLSEHRRGKDVLFALLSWFLAGSPANHETLRTVMTKIHEETPMRSALDLLLDVGHERGMQQGMQQGLQQGVQQGLLAGLRTLLERLLRARFGELPRAIDDRLALADAEALQQWGCRVLTAAHLDDVFSPVNE